VIIAVILVIVVISLLRSLGSSVEAPTNTSNKSVSLALVSDLSRDISPLPTLGRVVSLREAEVSAERQGEIIGVYHSFGDFVGSGTIIAEIENSSERASVLQARSNLDKLKKGSRDEEVDILGISVSQAESLLEEARISAINTIRSASATSEDVVRNKLDELFSNPQSDQPTLIFSTTNSQLRIDIENTRPAIEDMLVDWEVSISSLGDQSDLILSLTKAQENILTLRSFVDDIAEAVNALTPSAGLTQATITSWKTNAGTSRSSLSATSLQISQAKDALTSRQSSLEIAQKQLGLGVTGARSEDVEVAEATLSIARSNLEKTLIRAPISGTINFLEIEQGDFVSAFQPVLVISNNNALEIKAFVTGEDRTDIEVGSKVLIKNKVPGIVSKIAPAIDQSTKRVEVTITIQDSSYENLTNGESVQLLIDRSSKEGGDAPLVDISIPISALKITPRGVYVFTVNERSELVSLPIIIGPIVGEKIIVEEGLIGTESIVVDARGLKEGQVIEISSL